MPWYVECDSFRVPTAYKTETEAERKRELLDKEGYCKLPHRVVRVDHRGPGKAKP